MDWKNRHGTITDDERRRVERESEIQARTFARVLGAEQARQEKRAFKESIRAERQATYDRIAAKVRQSWRDGTVSRADREKAHAANAAMLARMRAAKKDK